MMLAFVASFMVNISGPFYFQGVMGYSPSQVGLLFLVVPLVTVVASPVSGWLFDKRYWKHYGQLFGSGYAGAILQADKPVLARVLGVTILASGAVAAAASLSL